jgi:hypothetical protein
MSLFCKKSLLAVAAVACFAPLAHATITYTCDATITADAPTGTCAYLNSITAGLYSSAFTNANSSIYIEMGVTGLGESSQYLSSVPYSTYVSDLTAEAGTGTVRTDALAALAGTPETTTYGGGNVAITSSLAEALGIPDSSINFGIIEGDSTPALDGESCVIGTTSCYNAVLTVTTLANLTSEEPTQTLYWDQTGGSQPSNAYDFYGVVEHETDEILGTASCIGTGGDVLTNGCTFAGAGTPSAVDLYRCSASNALLPDSALSQTAGQYFSYNGCSTNGAGGAVYNTLANGDDYADFLANTCGVGPYRVQDATGCPGSDPNINTDGGAEINILDAVGYNLTAIGPVPEPGTVALVGLGIAGVIMSRRRRRA